MGTLRLPSFVIASVYGGLGSVSGTVEDAAGDPAVRDVAVLDRASRKLIRTAVSTGGAYSVGNLRVGMRVMIIFTGEPGKNALILDDVTVA